MPAPKAAFRLHSTDLSRSFQRWSPGVGQRWSPRAGLIVPKPPASWGEVPEPEEACELDCCEDAEFHQDFVSAEPDVPRGSGSGSGRGSEGSPGTSFSAAGLFAADAKETGPVCQLQRDVGDDSTETPETGSEPLLSSPKRHRSPEADSHRGASSETEQLVDQSPGSLAEAPLFRPVVTPDRRRHTNGRCELGIVDRQGDGYHKQLPGNAISSEKFRRHRLTGKQTPNRASDTAASSSASELRLSADSPVVGHSLQPQQQGQRINVLGDGWGGNGPGYEAVVTEADHDTFTVIAVSGPELWRETHVRREFCTPVVEAVLKVEGSHLAKKKRLSVANSRGSR